MPLFRRRQARPRLRPGDGPALQQFWAWWDGSRDEVARVVEADDTAAVQSLIGPRVEAVHPDLEWEFGAGRDAKHLLVVSSGGRPELRPLAERWRRAGPPDDEAWEFRPARQSDSGVFCSGLVMSVGAVEINIAGVVAQAHVDDVRCRLDVQVFHPRFADIPEPARAHLAFLVLDWALGEDDVERWLGAVEPVVVEPMDRIQLALLGSLVGQMAQRWAGDRWALLEGWHGERRLIAAVRHPVHRVDHPLFDEHVSVRLGYASRSGEPGGDGLPTETAADDLQSFQETLVRRLGRSALLVAHETTSGERLLHLYCDSTASVVPQIEAMLGAYQGGSATVSREPDPAWRLLEHLRP